MQRISQKLSTSVSRTAEIFQYQKLSNIQNFRHLDYWPLQCVKDTKYFKISNTSVSVKKYHYMVYWKYMWPPFYRNIISQKRSYEIELEGFTYYSGYGNISEFILSSYNVSTFVMKLYTRNLSLNPEHIWNHLWALKAYNIGYLTGGFTVKRSQHFQRNRKTFRQVQIEALSFVLLQLQLFYVFVSTFFLFSYHSLLHSM